MLDPYSRHLIETAQIPATLTPEEVRGIVSVAYLDWIAQKFFNTPDGIQDPQNTLNRLALASGVLQNPQTEHVDPTSFLIAEASDIWLPKQEDLDRIPLDKSFKYVVHLLDTASFFHLADFDANANLLAQQAMRLLLRKDYYEARVATSAEISYFRTLGYFLRGHFGDCQRESAKIVEVRSTSDRVFIFLKRHISELVRRYLGERDDIPNDINQLLQTLTSYNVYPHFISEVQRLLDFHAVVERKGLLGLLRGHIGQEISYLNERISGLNNLGRPFAWPPVRDFCVQFFSLNRAHAVITVPTGGGKSFLAELAIVRAMRRGWVLYLAPTNALCAQIQRELKTNLASIREIEIDILLGGSEYMAERPELEVNEVIVMTPEKAMLFSKLDPERFQQCALVILDECHILNEGRRGEIAETVLGYCIGRNPQIQVILMSALIENSDQLAEWLRSRTRQEVAEISNLWRPTRSARLTALPELSNPQRIENRLLQYPLRIYSDQVTPWERETPLRIWHSTIQVSETRPGYLPWVNQAARKLGEHFANSGLRSLMFVLRNKHHAFSIAREFSNSNFERPEADGEEQSWLSLAEFELGATSVLRASIEEKAVAVHTRAMLSCERKASEVAFEKGRARTLIATGTLSQGLNLAADAVIIAGTKFAPQENAEMTPQERDRASLAQVLNAAGRAARANIARRGFTVIIPDNFNWFREHLSKQDIMRNLSVLRMSERHITINSRIQDLLNQVQTDLNIQENRAELILLSRLPLDEVDIRQTLNASLAGMNMQDERIEMIVQRLVAIQSRAVERGYSPWVIKAASLAGLPFPIAENLRVYILNQTERVRFEPPADSYLALSRFLIEWLRTLPLQDTQEVLSAHIKCWRRLGRDGDPDILRIMRATGYPQRVSPELSEMLPFIWENLAGTVVSWVNGDPYMDLARQLFRQPIQDQEVQRSDARYPLPRAIGWANSVVENLSRFAGLVLAVRDQWVLSDHQSIPDWFSNLSTLTTLPLGLRFGVRNLEALIWYREGIRERRAANYLEEHTPFGVADPNDQQTFINYFSQAKEHFTANNELIERDPIAAAIRFLIAE